jgi:6-phosphogluconolactonase (cycloisomerase 2 family)
MSDRLRWNRRDFVKLVGCSSLGLMTRRVPWLTGGEKAHREVMPRFAFVGYAGSGGLDEASGHGISVFAVEGERWKPTGGVRSDHPSFLALHPSERFLYAIQEVNRYENLSRGVVEAYAIDEKDGSLALLNRQPLSLSAIAPRHGAVSRDGRVLVIAVHGGGAYNVLPISEDGSLGRVSGILKETGSGPNEEHQQTAHPQMVMFDRAGHRFLGADLGSDRLSVFALIEGRPHVVQRVEARAGSGPRHMELHPNGRLLFVAGELDASVSCYRYDASAGSIREQLQHVSTNHGGGGEKTATLMAIHPSGQFLYTAARSERIGSLGNGIAAWRVDPGTGALQPIQRESDGSPSLRAMVMTAHGGSLLGLSRQSESVLCWRIDRTSGRLSRLAQVAKVQAPVSLALKYL